MKKNIWIFNHYATEMIKNKGGRHYNFSKHLKKRGYNSTIFCANSYHYNDSLEELGGKKYKIGKDENTKYVYVKTSLYKGNGFSRLKNMFLFFMNLLYVTKKYEKEINERPDVILASSVHPLTCVAGIFIAKRYGVKCIVEIRDLWPEAIVQYSDKWTKEHLIIKLLYRGEKWLYKKADDVIFTIAGGYDYIIDQGWEKEIPKSKVHYINNGVDIEAFDTNVNEYKLEDCDLEDELIIKVIYVGAIRRVNNLGILLDAAKKMGNSKVKFLLWGAGNDVESLKQRVIDEEIDNVVFKGYVNKQYIPYLLSKADINLAHYSFADINKYGTSRNKNFEYLASGKLTISTEEDKYDFPDDSVRLSKQCETAEDIEELFNEALRLDSKVKCSMEQKSREYACEYDFKRLTEKLIGIIEDEVI